MADDDTEQRSTLLDKLADISADPAELEPDEDFAAALQVVTRSAAKPEGHVRLWGALSDIVCTLAISLGETPRSIAEALFGALPADAEWPTEALRSWSRDA